LPQGGVSDVQKSQFGPVIVRVKGITPSTVKPYAEVADAVKKQVSASRAGDKIQALHDKIEDARVSGKSILEAAKAVGLDGTIRSPRRRCGQRPKRRAGQPARPGRLLRSAFAPTSGLDEAALNTKEAASSWFEVAKNRSSQTSRSKEGKGPPGRAG